MAAAGCGERAGTRAIRPDRRRAKQLQWAGGPKLGADRAAKPARAAGHVMASGGGRVRTRQGRGRPREREVPASLLRRGSSPALARDGWSVQAVGMVSNHPSRVARGAAVGGAPTTSLGRGVPNPAPGFEVLFASQPYP